jgi:predicted short-subunit dehydrogenase-like oxidoreductase (DUF2520 family)
MDIVLIGTGNTASVLGRKLKEAGHHIVQVYGRNSMAASLLAYELATESTNYWNVVTKEADIYILAVSDIAIGEIVRELHFPGKIIVHTAASVSKFILEKTSDHYGVFYPLQSLKKEIPLLPDTPIIIDASDSSTLEQLEILAMSITDQVVVADDDKRKKVHLAAVFCNNFVNHLYALAERYCKKEGIDFRLLLPLILETAGRVEFVSPGISQTGPAIRNDQSTMEEHLKMLESYPEMKKLYALLSQSIYLEKQG